MNERLDGSEIAFEKEEKNTGIDINGIETYLLG